MIHLSKHVIILWDEPFRLKHLFYGHERKCSPEILTLLSSLYNNPVDKNIFIKSLKKISNNTEKCENLFSLLLSEEFIIDDDSSETSTAEQALSNLKWQQATLSHIFSKRHLKFLDRLTEAEQFNLLVNKNPINISDAITINGAGIELPNVTSMFTELIKKRRTGRSYLEYSSISIETLAGLLQASLRVIDFRNSPFGIRFPLRSTPSCGGLNSVGTLMHIKSVTDIESGVYDYDPISHKLIKIDRVVPDWESCSYGQMTFSTAPVVFALYHRSSLFYWKYTDASAYDAILAEAGTILMSIACEATIHGLSVTPTNAIDTKALDALFPPEEYDKRYPLLFVAVGIPNELEDFDYPLDILSRVLGNKIDAQKGIER